MRSPRVKDETDMKVKTKDLKSAKTGKVQMTSPRSNLT